MAQVGPIQDPAQRLLKEQIERQRQHELQSDPEAAVNVPAVTIDLTKKPSQIDEVAPSFKINRIEFAGETLLLTREALQTITQPFEGLELGNNRIQHLLKRLTAAYVEAGYITTRCYIPEQNLSTGILKITVVPGRIAAFKENGTIGLSSAARFAFPSKEGDVLRLADLEQGVEQLSRHRFYKPQLSIEPGAHSGESIVILSLPEPLSWTEQTGLLFGIDNQGTRSTGEQRIRLATQAGNLFRVGEDIALSYVGARDSNALTGTTGFAWGYNTFNLAGTYSEYTQPIGDIATLFGDARSIIVGWNRVWGRDAAGRWGSNVSVKHHYARRFINDVALTPNELLVLRFATNKQWRTKQMQMSVEGAVSQGVKISSKTKDPNSLSRGDPHAQFTRFELSGNLQWALSKTLQIRQQLSAQWSNTGLYGTEQMFIGGVATVRGFKEDGLVGDRGVYLRNELGHEGYAIDKLDGRINPYVFFDTGAVQFVSNAHWKNLGGLGIGAHIQIKKAVLDIMWGIPAYYPFIRGFRSRFVLTAAVQF